MKQPQTHHLVDFASRYASQSIKTFTPASALWRAFIFSGEIDDLITLSEEAEKHNIRFGSTYATYELISYFSVGLVTCLEWHARCRLVHLMQYRPSSIQTKDIQGIADLAISQMAANGVAVSHLLGAAAKISSAQQYVTIFQRLFDDLDIKANAERTLRTVRADGDEMSAYERLEALYEYRHSLVHEISFGSIGPFPMRDAWSLDEAKMQTTNTVEAMKALELLITQYGPADFPERLDENGGEEDQSQKLVDAVLKLETEIAEALALDPEGLQKWETALVAQRAALQAEIEFIDAAETLEPVRYYNVKGTMKDELLRSRLAFLTALKSETGH